MLRFSREEKSVESFLKRVAKKCLILKELLKEQRALRYSAEWGGKVDGAEGSAKHAGAI